jgi:hypothetical protein
VTRVGIASFLLILTIPRPFSVIAFCYIALHSHEKLKKMQEIVKKVHHDKALKRTQFSAIIKKAM